MNLKPNEFKVYNFIKENKNNFLNLKMIEKNVGLSYPTIKSIIRILEVADLINIIKIGNNKFVKIKE